MSEITLSVAPEQVIKIGEEGCPSTMAILENAHGLARYAQIAQVRTVSSHHRDYRVSEKRKGGPKKKGKGGKRENRRKNSLRVLVVTCSLAGKCKINVDLDKSLPGKCI